MENKENELSKKDKLVQKLHPEPKQYPNISPYKKLDLVLEFLNTPVARPYLTLSDIVSKMKTIDFENNASELLRILAKLERDNMIYVENRELGKLEFAAKYSRQTHETNYRISFDGCVLLQEKGYCQKLINDNAENNRREKMERRTYYYTFWMAVGATGILIWEMIKYFCLDKHDTINNYYSLF